MSVVTVVFPFVPVMATSGVRRKRQASSSSLTTGIARRMVCEFGMSELGATALGSRNSYDSGSGVSEAVAARVDQAVMGLVDEAYATARRVLTERHGDLVRLSERLIEVESMDEQELDALFDASPSDEAVPTLREAVLVA